MQWLEVALARAVSVTGIPPPSEHPACYTGVAWHSEAPVFWCFALGLRIKYCCKDWHLRMSARWARCDRH